MIDFKKVEYQYPNGQRVLDAVSFSIKEGEVLALLGRSGAGKSTILKLINRLIEPSAGEVFVEGRPTLSWDAIELRRHIGYVLQDVGLFPHMTIRENIAVVPRLKKWPESRVGDRVSELMALVGLDEAAYARRFPRELSGGQRQRVGVARALAADPTVLLMDEPFGALDPMTRVEMHNEFKRIQERVKKTVVCVTHDLGEAFALATRIGVLAHGKLAALATPSEIAASNDPEVRAFLNTLPRVDRNDK